MKWLGGLLLLATTISFADVTVTQPPLTVSDNSGGSAQSVQQIKFGIGTTLDVSGSVATVTAAGGGGGASTLEVFSGAKVSSPTASLSLEPNDFSAQVRGGTTFYFALNPATTDFIHNQTTLQSATFKVSSGTVATQLNTNQLHFNSVSAAILHPDNTVLLALPDVNSMYLGYNTNLINTGGTFNFSAGPTAMPYPGAGNFNSCVGAFCMSGNVITTAENNNSMGYASCGNLRAGFYNSCMGGSSGNGLRDGNYNTYNGAYSGNSNQDNNGITAMGFESSRYLNGGDYVTTVGYQAGVGTTTANANLTGSGDTYIGRNTGQGVRSDTVVSNSFAIGTGALVSASGEGQLGGRLGSGTETLVRMASATVETASLNIRNVSYLWPSTQGTGVALITDGSGNLRWGNGIASVSNSYTATSTATVIMANASGQSLTVTLPDATTLSGTIYRIKRLNSGANTVTIATTSAQTIDGQTTQILNLQYVSVDLISDGSNWSII